MLLVLIFQRIAVPPQAVNAGFPGTAWLVLALTSSGPGAGGCLGLRCPRTISGKAREGASGFAGRT
jgi:hypothetical protein